MGLREEDTSREPGDVLFGFAAIRANKRNRVPLSASQLIGCTYRDRSLWQEISDAPHLRTYTP